MLYNNILELIGNTPLVKINNLNSGSSSIFAKVEYFNPTGSSKDRAAYYMLKKAQEEGKISKNTIIIEPTSGNTGIGLAMVSQIMGYELILTMPENMSKERQDILKIYGAQVVLTPKELGMQGAIDKAQEIHKEIKDSIILQQFSNPNNLQAHYETTANEIINDLRSVDIFIAGIGTAGTICGVAKKLKEYNANIKIIGVEPKSSPLITQGKTGIHKIQGIGANFIPKLFNKNLVDEVIAISDEDAIKTAQDLAKKEGLFVGISSGAAMKCALDISEKEQNKNIVVLLPDNGLRYLSSELIK